MIVVEILIFTAAFFVAKYFWDHRRFFYLAHKIPMGNFDYSLRGIYRAITADNVTIFKIIRESCSHDKVCSKAWLGPLLFVLIKKPEDVKLVLNLKNCLNKPKLSDFANIPKGSLFGDVKYWHSHKRILNPYFGAKSLQNIIPIFNEKVKVLMSNLEKKEENGEFNILNLISAFTLETIFKAMEYDMDFQNQKSEASDVFIENLKKYFKIVSNRFFKFWLYPDFIFKSTKLYQQQHESESKSGMGFAKDIILNAQNQMKDDENNNEKSRTFIRALVNAENNLSMDEIQDEVKSIILAGQDTSAIASSSTLLLLAMHKDIQQKVVDELHRTFGNTLDAPHMDYEKINELQYLDMVINEVLRILPVVPFVVRISSSDIEISEGCIIPAGAYILVSIFELHRSKNIWGEDADMFHPERFEKESFKKIPSYGFIPFSKGPRMCVGWRYSTLLMKVQLANILLRYEVDTSLKLEELEFVMNLTMNVSQGYKISLKKRTIN